MCRWDPYARLTLMPFLHLYPLSLSISSLWKQELGLWECWPCRRKLSSAVFMTCFTLEIKGQTSRDRGGSRSSPCYGCHGDVTHTHMLSLRRFGWKTHWHRLQQRGTLIETYRTVSFASVNWAGGEERRVAGGYTRIILKQTFYGTSLHTNTFQDDI